MNDIALSAEMVALVPVIAGVLQALKKIPLIDQIKAYMPFISMLLSFGVIYAQTSEIQIIPAVIMGLTASGLYSGVKAIS